MLICGPHLVIDGNARIVWLHDKQLDMSKKQFDMLYYLASNHGRVLTKGQIFEYLSNEPDIEVTNSIAKRIHYLRQLIEDDPSQPQYIHTVCQVGYRFEKKPTTIC